MCTRVLLLTLAVALAVPAVGRGQSGPASVTNSSETSADNRHLGSADSAARLIRFDVIATDSRGRGVPDLRAADFELLEDGFPRPIDEARFITARPAGADDIPNPVDSEVSERAEAADPHVRLIAIFLDEYHVAAENTERVRAAVARFVERSLSARDLVIVMRPLDSLFTIRLTRDRDRILESIGQFDGRQSDYAPRTSYERNFMAGTPARIEQLRAQVATSALNALASHLGNLNRDARKTLIVVSEGLPRVDRRRGLESLPTIDTVTRSANRYNVSIYPVDPRRLASAAAPADSAPVVEPDALRGLAASTDGRPIVTVADLGDAMQPIALDASAYYVLRYSTTLKPDGRFHEVQVRVRKPGVTIRTRKGYWSAPADDGLRAALGRARAPAAVEPPRRVSPLITAWFGAARGADGKTRVTFVWEPSPSVPGSKRPTPARVQLKALAADDTALFDGPVAPTGPLRADARGDATARAEFEVAPGVVRLRMSIENESEQTVDSDVRDITVRDLSAAVVLGTPQVFRGRTARDFRSFESGSASPVASREFSRTERLLIRVPAYAPAGAPVTVTARLMNRRGQLIRDLAVRPGPRASAPAEIDIPLAGFAGGQYRLEIAANSQTAETRDILEFRVTN